ncbi:HlyD family secretion protein [Massilia sp. TS11]|uniref:HlyD family secretion protein n=1 Tax=Massilia sp. TS11 TaxID=2908003 RepID=UPI001EDAC0CD|nr:HlyD family secretion protein [Massilia sp. TS11]MCG2586389.1 HlyD family secretion protein [Massilia sp. TS11]
MTTSTPVPDTPTPPSRARLRLVLLVLLPLLAAIGGGLFWLHGGRYVETDNAYVKADMVPVGADVAGSVREVFVRENEVVQAGQLLFRIDPAPYAAAVARAEARLAQARTDVAALKASYREKQAEITLARTRQAFALKDQQRQGELVARQFVSASRFDDARQATELAAQQVTALEQDLKRIGAALGGTADLPEARHPAVLAALAELEQARIDLARTQVRAPAAGTVSKPPKVGQYVQPGSPALALVASSNLWVEANYPETDLTYVRPGNPVTLQVDTYPGQLWHGTVDSLSPATGAEFAVLPAQNATGNWVKIAQRVPVRIRLQATPQQPPLRAGLSVVADIDTGHQRHLPGA